MSLHPANKLANLRRRVNRARRFPDNTCPASRHLHTMADALSMRGDYPMLREEPEHCAGAMYAVLEALWKARTRLAKLEPKPAGDLYSGPAVRQLVEAMAQASAKLRRLADARAL